MKAQVPTIKKTLFETTCRPERLAPRTAPPTPGHGSENVEGVRRGPRDDVQHVGTVVRLVQKAALHNEAKDLLVGQALVGLLGQRGDLPEHDPEGPVGERGQREGSERGPLTALDLSTQHLPAPGAATRVSCCGPGTGGLCTSVSLGCSSCFLHRRHSPRAQWRKPKRRGFAGAPKGLGSA